MRRIRVITPVDWVGEMPAHDVPGAGSARDWVELAAEAESVEALRRKLNVMIPEPLVLNGVIGVNDRQHPEVPIGLPVKHNQVIRLGC